MAVRIYSLAKELKLDSKELVDICTKAGVTGKGSALASLTDEEVDRSRSFSAAGGRSGRAASDAQRSRRHRAAAAVGSAGRAGSRPRAKTTSPPAGVAAGKPPVLDEPQAGKAEADRAPRRSRLGRRPKPPAEAPAAGDQAGAAAARVATARPPQPGRARAGSAEARSEIAGRRHRRASKARQQSRLPSISASTKKRRKTPMRPSRASLRARGDRGRGMPPPAAAAS